MESWLQNILGIGAKNEEDLTAFNPEDDGMASGGKLSSVEKSAQRQQAEREMKERLDAFLKMQQKLDKDGDFSKQDREAATQQFYDEDALRQKSETPATLGDVETQINDAILQLENNLRLLPYGGDDEDLLEKDENKPVWSAVPRLPDTTGKTVGMNLRIKTVATESVAPVFEWDFDKWTDLAP